MIKATPEPGFVQAYRLFVIVRILFWLAVGPVLVLLALSGNPAQVDAQITGAALIRRLSLPDNMPILLVEILLLGLLLWRPASQRLGGWFVPVTLLIGLAPLLVGYYWWPAQNPLQSPFVMFFFVMAVLIAWEYQYRYVLLFVVGLTVFEALVAPPRPAVPWTVPAGWLVLQAVMMLLGGYVTATLASVQRQQRSDLADAYQRQASANRRLQEYAATLEELTISRERNRLSRELHDTLAHSLSALTVQLEAVRSLWDTQPEKARRILEQADETARTGLAEARRALQALRAAPLDDLGLQAALEELARAAARRTGAALDLRLPGQMSVTPSEAIEHGIYRIAQETLENIARHARPSAIRVELLESEGCLELNIEDDGLGIDPDALSASGAGDDHLGMRVMQERARYIGAQLEISSAAGQGTRVCLRVPVERQGDGSGPDL